jgi:hypothetical protein
MAFAASSLIQKEPHTARSRGGGGGGRKASAKEVRMGFFHQPLFSFREGASAIWGANSIAFQERGVKDRDGSSQQRRL